MKKFFGILGIVILVLLIVIGITIGPDLIHFLKLDVVSVDNNLTLFLGYGGNSLVLFSEDHMDALIVDSKMAGGASKLRNFVDEEAPGARVTIVNTHAHGDHSQGNAKFPEARIIAGAYEEALWKKESGMDRLPDVSLKAGQEHTLVVDEDTVFVRNMGRAHTYNDVVVYIPGRRLLLTGDILFHEWHPALFKEEGSHIVSWIHTFDRLLEWDFDTVVPGHGQITNKSGLIEAKAYFESIQKAAGDDEQLKLLKKKYEDYFSLPGTTGFDKTVAFINAE